jgi:hypothetical protein
MFFLPLKFVDNRSELWLIFEFGLILVFWAFLWIFFEAMRCLGSYSVFGQKYVENEFLSKKS